MKIKVISDVDYVHAEGVLQLISEIMPSVKEAAKYLSTLPVTPAEILIKPEVNSVQQRIYGIYVYIKATTGTPEEEAIEVAYDNIYASEKQRLENASELKMMLLHRWADHIGQALRGKKKFVPLKIV